MATEWDKEFLSKILHVQINEPAIHRKVRQIQYVASTLKGNNKTAWLLKAVTCIDLTTLGGDDTNENVRALCAKAVHPVKLPYTWQPPLCTAAVCVYPSRVNDAVIGLSQEFSSHNVSIASVGGGFPSGQYPLISRLQEIGSICKMEVDEIDVVIDRSLVLTHQWLELLKELKEYRRNSSQKCLKVILSTGELFSLKDVYIASMLAMRAGCNFIKTSTGKETVNATLPVGIVMCRAIKDYEKLGGRQIGFKPAGGIKTVQDALEWMVLVQTELGSNWLNKKLFRLGASSLLDNIASALAILNTVPVKSHPPKRYA